MPIKTLQGGRLRSIAKIRAGVKKPSSKPGGKPFPAALPTFRITSASRQVADLAAQAFGGAVEPWEEPLANPPRQWQVITDLDTLPILIPPTDGCFSQWNEMWSAAGCARRCDGEWEMLTGQKCECPADADERAELAKNGEACRPTTRLTVVVQELEELGGVDFESKSWHTARELLGGGAPLFKAAADRGVWIPAQLRLSPRVSRRPGQPVRRFVVTDLVATFSQTLEVLNVAGRQQLTPGGPAELGQPHRALPAGPPEAAAGEEDYLDDEPGPGSEAAEGPPVGDVDHGQDEAPPAAGDKPAEGLPVDVDERVRLLLERGHQAGLQDDETCDVVHAATRGRSRNPKHLNTLEWTVAFELVNKIRRGDISLTAGDQRPRHVCDPQGRRLHVAWTPDATLSFTVQTSDNYLTGRDWQELIRGTGITKTALLRQAASIANQLGQPSPSIDELHDPDLASRLKQWVDDNKKAGAA